MMRRDPWPKMHMLSQQNVAPADDDLGLRPETLALLTQGASLGKTVVVLGDSIVHGTGLPFESIYPAILERMIHQQPGLSDWRVINAGIPGDTTLKACGRYMRHVRPVRPRLVLLAFGLNDANLRRSPLDARRERIWWMQRCVITRALWGVLRRCARFVCPATNDAHQEQPPMPRPRVGPRTFYAALAWLVARAQRDGAWVGLVSLTPVSMGLPQRQRQQYARYDDLLRRLAHRRKVPLFDLQAAAVPAFDPSSMWMPDGLHLTAAGQEWLAQRLYPIVSERMAP
jgi:lysophospholipase L1-like esterase